MEETQHMINNQLICPICLENYEWPKVLTCLHTFCQKCICKHVRSLRREETQSDKIACPVCRSEIRATANDQTPDEWAAKLPINSTVLALLTSGRPGRHDSVYCEPCSKDGRRHISVAYCVTCTEYLCDTCYNCHKNFQITHDHTFTINTLPENPNANGTDDRIYRCASHNKRFTYFCSHHKELCCCKCAINVHRTCVELANVEDLAKDIKEREDPKQISDNLEAVKELFHILLENRSNCQKSIENQKTMITKSLKDWRIAINGHIDKVVADALQKLDQVCKLETIVVSDQIAECKSSIAAIDTSHRMLNEDTKSVDDTKVFMTIERISKQVQNYLQRYDVFEQDSEEVHIEFRYNKTPEDFVQAWSSIGEVDSHRCRIPKLSSRTSLGSAHFSARVPGDNQVCNISSGIFLPDEKLVLLDTTNRKLKLFDNKSNFLDQLKVNDCPRYICRVDHRTVAVTVDTNVKFFSVCNTFTHLRTIDVGKRCDGIASHQENILVDTFENCKDSLVTFDNSYSSVNIVQLGGSLSNRNTHCISPDGKIFYYTVGKNIITINMKGQQLNVFESNDLKNACGITVDKNGIIYCCDNDSNTVVQVSPEGKQLGVLLSPDCGLKKPVGICLNDKNNMILVFEEKSDYVKEFRLK